MKVLDFGISKALSETRKYTMNVFASTAYSSPERIETQRIDTQSDLWSVGVLLYQIIAGKLPFDEASKERLERRIRSSSLPDPLPASCPDPLRRIIFKMLAKDPARRYGNAAEVIDELTRYRRGQPVLAEEPENEATVRTTLPLDDSADNDATVRTTAPLEDDDATFRTVTGPKTTTAPKTSSPVGADYRPPRRRIRPAMGCFVAFAFLAVLLLGVTMWQMNYSQQASQLRTDLQAEKVTNLDQAWDRYQKLAAKSHLPFLLWGARSAMKQRLEAAADSVIAEYRNNDAPAVYEAQWKDAKENLGRALEIDPDDRGIKGRYRLCEAHLERIAAARARPNARQKLLNSAVNKFEEAAQLLKRSPDPYLGLARLYVYDLNDVERAEEALKKAEDYGHPMGRREMAQLADGYRRRADRIWRESRGFSHMPDQEKDYLDKARQDYLHAQDLYARSGLFGDAARSQVLAIQGQQKIEQRLEDLRSGGSCRNGSHSRRTRGAHPAEEGPAHGERRWRTQCRTCAATRRYGGCRGRTRAGVRGEDTKHPPVDRGYR